MRKIIVPLTSIAAVLAAGTASAYVGPGAGISVLGALWGLIIGVVMAIGVILFWPIRMMLRKRKAAKAEAAGETAAEKPPETTAQEANSSQNS